MKNPFSAAAPTYDAQAINETIERALASAGLDTRSGLMQGVTETIRRALAPGGAARTPTSPAQHAPQPHTPQVDDRQASGSFVGHQFSNAAGTRAYKLYVPAQGAHTALPVVVMLHGCTQSADDFAAGTQMNRLADQLGFLVVYPEQAAGANPSRCWNWFQPQDQARDAGEPSLLAGLVREVVTRHGADPRRVFVAGLSAGAAMAVILGEAYPELFAGVGAHSGLPLGSAHDIPSALAAMKQRRPPARPVAQAVPVIVFHGDRDHTVQHANGVAIAEQALQAHRAKAGGEALLSQTQRGQSAGGRGYTRTVHTDASGTSRVEAWTLHGAGHAWSGGDASGSFTDGSGPDASAQMLRFFLSLPRAGSA